MRFRTPRFREIVVLGLAVGFLAGPPAAPASQIPVSSIGWVTTEGQLSPPALQVRGTNGFQIYVVGTNNPPEAPQDFVTLHARRGNQHVAYQVVGTVRRNFVRAKFGELGSVNMKFDPTKGTVRRDQPGGCGAVRVRKGKFSGRLTFTGENGFTYVDARRGALSGPPIRNSPCSVNMNVRPIVPNVSGYNGTPPTKLFPVSLQFWADKGSALSPTVAYASAWGYSADMEILREVAVVAPSNALTYDGSSAAVAFPQSFIGAATFSAQPQQCSVRGVPSGSLSVELPGLGVIDLLGGGFQYSLTIPGGAKPTSANCPA